MLVDFVVAMWVEFSQLRQFWKLEFLQYLMVYFKVINAVFNPPIDEVVPHFNSFLQVEFSGP
jgi:hypothetical protein